RRGVTIVDADLASRAVVAPGEPALEAIVDRFGAVLQDDGSLDRRALRDIVFSDEQARRDLEAIT
ncbi:MAG TPA: dephospho-CoA kinase, partial [Alcanivorax sp.]|nr:dephospho-CoA kinase [Alcanivorax sp.]